MEATVDFSKAAYFPLVKERMGLFQENETVNGEIQFLTNLPQIGPTPGSTFRVLGRFDKGKNFNTPPSFTQLGTSFQVRTNPALDRAFAIIRQNNKTPLMSWYGNPAFLQRAGDPTGIPNDLQKYGDAMGRLAALYGQRGAFIWEVMNEPNLDRFFSSPNNIDDYAKIYRTTAKAIKARAPDVMIAGPAISSESPAEMLSQFTREIARDRSGRPPLPMDYFSFHNYRDVARTKEKLNDARNAVGSNYNIVPFLITEYENYPPGASFETKALREKTIGAINFLNHATMLAEQTDVASVTWNRFMTNRSAGQGANPGGLLSFEGQKRAIYNAMVLYGWLPADRNVVRFPGGSANVAALAGSDEHNAGVLLWNNGQTGRRVTVRLANLPQAVRRGRLRLYRIDTQHASGADGANPEMIPENEQTLNRSGDAANAISVTLPAMGIVYARIDDRSGRSLGARRDISATFVRSWSWVPRLQNGANYISTGDYGTFDPASWTLRIGTRTAAGIGLAGVTIDHAPHTLRVRITNRGGSQPKISSPERMTALRVDYWTGAAWTKSVLLHGTEFNRSRTTVLPWGKGGALADLLVDKGVAIGNGSPIIVDLDAYAPPGWSGGQQRRMLVSAWTQANGIDSQTVISLGDKLDD